VAEAVRAPSGEAIEAITAAAVRLRSASRGADAALVIVSAREAPVAEDLRLVMTLIQLAQHQALIANQVESDDDAIDQLNVEIFKAALDLEGSSSQREQAYRHALIARSLQRNGRASPSPSRPAW
jgi:phosphate uptake regulator